MDHARYNMANLGLVIVVRPKNVAWYHRRIQMTVLIMVGMILYVYQTFRIGITIIGSMWWSIVHHCFVNWIAGLVRKYAGGEAGDNLCAALFVCRLQYMIVYQQIVTLQLVTQ